MLAHIVTFAIGMVFALGFGLGGVADPATIVGFLDFLGDWNPSVALVMVTAVAVTSVAYRLMFRHRTKPVLATRFAVPTRRDIDRRLVLGAVVFGFGWGLAGLCPGPALAALGSGSLPVVVFLAAMVGGMLAFGTWDRASARRAAAAKAEPASVTPAPSVVERGRPAASGARVATRARRGGSAGAAELVLS